MAVLSPAGVAVAPTVEVDVGNAVGLRAGEAVAVDTAVALGKIAGAVGVNATSGVAVLTAL